MKHTIMRDGYYKLPEILKIKDLKTTNRDRKKHTNKNIQLTARYKIIFSCHYNHLSYKSLFLLTTHSYVTVTTVASYPAIHIATYVESNRDLYVA